jgi:hypothetical protein
VAGTDLVGITATNDDGWTSPEVMIAVPVQPALPFLVTEYTAGRQGAVYDVSQLSTVWKNVAGTDPVTAVDDIVRRVDDVSGRGHHLLADSDAQAPLLKLASGKYRPKGSATQFMHSAAGGYTMGPLAHYMIFAGTRSSTSTQHLLLASASSTRFHRLSGGSSQRGQGSLRNSPTLAETIVQTPGSGEFPINTPKVIGSLAVASQNDVAVNGVAPSTIANSWTTESITGARIGLGTDLAASIAGGAAWTFYGVRSTTAIRARAAARCAPSSSPGQARLLV